MSQIHHSSAPQAVTPSKRCPAGPSSRWIKVGDIVGSVTKASVKTPLRLSRAAVVLSVFYALTLCGCAGLVVRGSAPSTEEQGPIDRPMMIRTLGSDQEFSEVPAATVAEQLRVQQQAGEPLNILALSSGGAYGAFGAGAMIGLTRSGWRPEFSLVTGVSAGALIAPYAFLGPTWDARLQQVYTSGVADHLLQRQELNALFGSSLYSGRPLQELVDAYVSDEMIQSVAREAAKGRLLLVATTDVATGERVIWDLGAIARNGGHNARILFRDVLVASASVPGAFPPVLIRVREDGATHTQAHMDGIATGPFFIPPAFLQPAPETRTETARVAVFVIVNGPLSEASGATRLTTRAILSRSIHAGLNHMLRATLELTAATAHLQGATLQYAAVPTAYPLADGFDFRAVRMRPLFSYAEDCAQAGRLWTAFSPSVQDNRPPYRRTERQVVPCPVDDAFIGQFAAR
jgi:predicted acylesterase/phospholipase RssA